MDKRERVITAIKGKLPDAIPVAPFLGQYVFATSGRPWRELWEDPASYVTAEISCWHEFGYDAVWVPSLDEVAPAVGSRLQLFDDRAPVVDQPAIKKRDDLDTVSARGEFLASSRWIGYKLEVIDRLRREVGPDVPIIVHGNNPFRLAGNLVGIENFYLLMIEDPFFAHEILELCLSLSIKSNNLLANGGADVLWIAQPTANANCISRPHYEEFVHPYNLRLFSETKKTGVLVIMHTCGQWKGRFDLVAAEGVDMLHVDGADLIDLRNGLKGRCSIMGEIPTDLLIDSTPDAIVHRAKEDMWNGGVAGGFILAASCSLSPLTPSDNIRALVAACKNYGIYPLSKPL